ncbi:hypothetical protein RhiirC2_797318 [Rhizophagus irregularis]|uniref:SWIM-type domain-containing protein n=1 Tax=Rhizophagus irregularis TaxID=588596 RepID=A0A2N1M884_9GLOM|nr:hypothetical protein RhiirC2_797318 [Rhizophagus irregularis]
MYTYVGYLAFARIKKNKDNNYVALNGYLKIKISRNHEEIVYILSNVEQHLLNILQQQCQNNANSKILSIINDALEFVKYFNEYWIGNIEFGWTYYGKLIAANILNVFIDSIPNTNNHLEAFNNQLKTHHLNRFQNGGHLLRLDVLSVLLIKNTRFIQYTSEPKKSDQNLQKINQLTYFIPDKLCEQKAKTIIQEKQIINVEYTKDSLLLWIKSSESNQIGQKIYTVILLPNIYCQCLDFLSRGGACKHIRAAIIWINWL